MNWRPISEAPKDGTVVDLWDGARFSDCHWSDDKERWQDGDHKRIYADPTHFCIVTPPGEQQPESVNQRLLDAAENYCIVERDLYDAVGSSETERILKLHKQEKASRQELYAAIDAAKQAKQ